jgi:hypothetical protein
MAFNWDPIIWNAARLVGFVLAAGITFAAISMLRRQIVRFLTDLIPNEKLVSQGTNLVMFLMGLEGLRYALRFINQDQLNVLFGGLVGLVSALAGVIQWTVYIAVLIFIAYNIKGLVPSSGDQK